MKRRLWARLLTTALGTQFEDSDELFVEHTYLVNTAEIIAHALVGFDLAAIAPASLLSGGKFEESGISGVVEADFFDWVVHVPGGEPFVRSLARRVGRFRWQEVGGDVLKVLYESVITAPTRKRLGEYYTPDWLAERIVSTAIERAARNPDARPVVRLGDLPLPRGPALPRRGRGRGACRSQAALSGLTRHVLGMDLHPVAVTLARVTYLLAIGRDRLTHPDRGPIQVPVYPGRRGPVAAGGARPVLRRQPGRRDRRPQATLRVGASLPGGAARRPGAVQPDRRVDDEAGGQPEARERRAEALGALPALRGVPRGAEDAGRDLPHALRPPRRGPRPHLELLRPQPGPALVARPAAEPRRCAGREPALAGLPVHDRGDAGGVPRLQRRARARGTGRRWPRIRTSPACSWSARSSAT